MALYYLNGAFIWVKAAVSQLSHQEMEADMVEESKEEDEDDEEHQRQVLAAFDEHQNKLENIQKAHEEEVEALERLQLVSARF